MTRSDLIKVMNPIARESGYRSKSGLYWKRGMDLLRTIQLQSSKWGNGVYVNFGLVLHSPQMDVPPGLSRWDFADRAETLSGSPITEYFRVCAIDETEELRPTDMAEPFRWLVKWIEEQWASEDNLRQQVANPRSDMHRRGPVSMALKDWARAGGVIPGT